MRRCICVRVRTGVLSEQVDTRWLSASKVGCPVGVLVCTSSTSVVIRYTLSALDRSESGSIRKLAEPVEKSFQKQKMCRSWLDLGIFFGRSGRRRRRQGSRCVFFATGRNS